LKYFINLSSVNLRAAFSIFIKNHKTN